MTESKEVQEFRARMSAALELGRGGVCSYLDLRTMGAPEAGLCDCKGGCNGNMKFQGELSGCPEINIARVMLESLTPFEFARVAKRVKLRID